MLTISCIVTFSGVGRHIWSPEVDLKTVLKVSRLLSATAHLLFS